MKKIIFSFVLLLVFSSAAAAAVPLLSDFPIGMTKAEAVAKGLVFKDQQGGLINIMFGGREWPTALVFENDKLVYLLLKESGDEYTASASDGLWQLGWLTIYVATDKDLVFDAIKLASSGMDETAIGEEYESFQEIMQSQGFKNSFSLYVSDRVWMALKQLRGEHPVEKYPDATICNVTTDGNNVSLVFSTFRYMENIFNESANSANADENTPKQ